MKTTFKSTIFFLIRVWGEKIKLITNNKKAKIGIKIKKKVVVDIFNKIYSK